MGFSRALAIVATLVTAQVARAEVVTVPAMSPVQVTMDALEEEVEAAGATVFARIDHAKGAANIGQDIAASQLLIFGNPEIGTPAIQSDPLAGLILPLKVLVYENTDGEVLLAYERPVDMFADTSLSEDSEVVAEISGVLQRLTNKAAITVGN